MILTAKNGILNNKDLIQGEKITPYLPKLTWFKTSTQKNKPRIFFKKSFKYSPLQLFN